ncbi:MAG: TIGR01777 family protein [Gammaproteobacteria bacterium]|nr:TIGR01777 family oxidoreductase [Gammaproteobacteria bacterium]MCP5136916.1 TIGR01777 family protein [Gammaproteobacteria bacterium]
MQVVIAGGTGFIGQALSESLLADGHQVTLLSRSQNQRRPIAGAALAVWNGKDMGDWTRSLDGVDAVVNLAGAPLAGEGALPTRWTRAYKSLIRDSRINAGRALASAIETLDRPPKVLIQASGIGVYGSWRDAAPVCDEQCAHADDFLAQLAVDWEASTATVEACGVRHVAVRTSVVLDGQAGALPRIAMPIRFGVGGPLGSGRQTVSWIHRQDEVRAIRFLMEHEDLRGAFNLAAPDARSNEGFGRALARTLHRPFWMPTPGFVMRAMLGEAADLVLRGQQVMPAALLRAGFEFRFANLESALAEIYAAR